MSKERLDIVVQQRYGVTRSKAQGLIQTGCLLSEAGEPLVKPGMRIEKDAPLQLLEGPRFVSRGGDKLAHAIETFPINVRDRIVIDVGASTGGFTDCLLQYGAARVYAVDVGYGQLAWALRQDTRVVVMERCNIRSLTPEQLNARPDFFTADCSFISLKLVLPAVLRLLGDKPEGVALIKPQFEAGREKVGRGGVVRDPNVHEAVIREISATARQLGFRAMEVTPSPLLGPAGNREFLAYLHGFCPELHPTETHPQ
ncbi:MAG TPA: TlyA family RNA methyltransferase [Candidatus Hydrogenedentes bacterium]|nr:TlyA family RNA methyltransferase [Candidatus Hydrogenedentota bacterium]